ncbi:MAG: YfiR family protein [Nitrospiraceae bacterium]
MAGRIRQRFRRVTWGRPTATLPAVVLTLVCTLSPSTTVQALESGHSAEYLLKAAFLYNIAKFIDWPDAESAPANAPLSVCMTGDAFGSTIDSIAGKSVQGRPVVIKHTPNLQDARDCHILFVETNYPRRADEFLEAVSGRPVLTVCDRPDCAQQGVMINLQKREDKISIELNLDAAQRAHLKLSSQLIKLARLVGPRS